MTVLAKVAASAGIIFTPLGVISWRRLSGTTPRSRPW
jgi:hypothetical protein